MLRYGCATIALVAGMMPLAAFAQDQAPRGQQAAPETDVEEGEEIVVSGQLRGAVEGDIPPEIQLNQADIRALGVPTIADLITELAPQTGSARGRGGERPVVLLNGRRISNFREIGGLPTEAIERVDILPEEVALTYGFRADQKVVNIVLRRRFQALTAEVEGGAPTAGGFATVKTDANILKISRDKRFSLDVDYRGSSGLLESERDVVSRAQTGLFNDGKPGDLTPYRTLRSPSQDLTLNGVYSQNISPKISASLNASLELSQRQSLLGLPSVVLTLPGGGPFTPSADDVQINRYLDDLLPLSRSTASQTVHGGFALNGDGLPWSDNWRWSLTGNYDRVTTRSITDTGVDPAIAQARLTARDPAFNPFAPIPFDSLGTRAADTANSTSSIGSLDALLRGPVLKLPAGDFATTIRLTGRTSDFDSQSFRGGIARSGSTSRDGGSAQANFDLPIASRRREVLSALGDLSLNANVEVEQLSDFGRLVTTGYGFNWSPIRQVRLIGSVTDEEGAPTAQQLGDPSIATPGVIVFDYLRGESAIVTSITGGNAALGSDSRRVTKLGLNLRPFDEKDFSFSADYVTSTTRNQISAFPAASAAVEAAFPGRFVRDGGGRLLSVDNRAVNFARAERSQLRWGFNFSTPLPSKLEKEMQARRADFEKRRAEAEANGTPLPERPRGPRGEGQGQRPESLFGNNAGPRGPGGPGGGGRGFGGGGRGGFGGANGALAGRLNFSLYHTVHFKELVVIRDSLPVLDLLNGAATGNRGGQPRHEIEAQAGVSKDGLGLRLNAKWQSATTVLTGAVGSGDSLDFGSQTTLGLRLFADLGQQRKLVREHPFFRGTRVTLSVDNLLDSHPRVTDRNGMVPISYQPDLLDPAGRVIRLSFRKLFF